MTTLKQHLEVFKLAATKLDRVSLDKTVKRKMKQHLQKAFEEIAETYPEVEVMVKSSSATASIKGWHVTVELGYSGGISPK